MKYGTIMAAIFLSIAAAPSGAEPGSCTDCHSKPPVRKSHLRVEKTDPAECMTCHESSGSDALFTHLHESHLKMGIECSACHAGAPDRARLDDLMKPSAAALP